MKTLKEFINEGKPKLVKMTQFTGKELEESTDFYSYTDGKQWLTLKYGAVSWSDSKREADKELEEFGIELPKKERKNNDIYAIKYNGKYMAVDDWMQVIDTYKNFDDMLTAHLNKDIKFFIG